MKKMIEFGNFKADTFTTSSSLIDQNDLSVSENYLSVMSHDATYVLEKYSVLLFEYMLLFFEKIKVVHFRYIFERGVETVTNVFVGLLEYTKNVDLAFNHGKKAFYFYIEFIEQISDVQNSFLQLTPRDAIMFVYKRTIFEVNKEMVKTTSESTGKPHFYNICKICSSYFIQTAVQPVKINAFVRTLNIVLSEVIPMDSTNMEIVLKELLNLDGTASFLDDFTRLVRNTTAL